MKPTKTSGILYWMVLLLVVLIYVSCSKDDNNEEVALPQEVSFGFDLSLEAGRINSDLAPAKVRVTIKNLPVKVLNRYPDGEILIQEGLLLELFAFGNGYVSESVILAPSSYQLTLFQILDENDQVIYVSPMEGSEKAPLVDNPLPILFEVASGETTRVNPEVIPVAKDDDPGSFGYAEFGFKVIETFNLDFAVLSDWDSSLLASTIHIVERDEAYNILNAYETTFSAEGLENISLKKEVPVYEIIVEHPEYHSNSYVTNTSLLQDSRSDLLLYMSRRDETRQFYLSVYPYSYQSYIVAYLPTDPCIQYMRIDFAGWPQEPTKLMSLNHAWGFLPDYPSQPEGFMESSVLNPIGNYLVHGFMHKSLDLCM
ncbi:MAG: hypothetical protein AAFY41_12960, partial [Bacteroidota bacterium]